MQVSQGQVVEESCRVSGQQQVPETPYLTPESASFHPAKLDPISTRSISARKSAQPQRMSGFSFKRASVQQQQPPDEEKPCSSNRTERGPGRQSCRTSARASQTSLVAESPKIDSNDEVSAWKDKGNAAFKQGNWEAAVEAYTR